MPEPSVKPNRRTPVTKTPEIQQPVTTVQQQPTIQQSAPTAYQANLASLYKNAEQIITPPPTSREVYGRIAKVNEFSPSLANKLYTGFEQAQNTQSSPYFAPYKKATNAAVAEMASYGYDTSVIDNDFYTKNSDLLQYRKYNGTTNTPSSPGTKASVQEKASYALWQLEKAQDTTNSAHTEWDALQDELTYYANSPLNYSEEEIMEKVYGPNYQKGEYSAEFKKKYPTLFQMDESLRPTSGQALLELNDGIDYSVDNCRTVIWRARNKDISTGVMDADSAMSVNGVGNQWKEDPEITAKRTAGTDTYSPNSLGMTMEEEGKYFNRDSFDQQWVDDNSYRLNSLDPVEKKNYINVMDGEARTQDAESELEALNKKVDGWIASGVPYERALKLLDIELESGDYKTLVSMDKGMAKGTPVELTRAVDYRKADVQEKLRNGCKKEEEKKDTTGIVMDGVLSTIGIILPSLHDVEEPQQKQNTDSGKAPEMKGDTKKNRVGNVLDEKVASNTFMRRNLSEIEARMARQKDATENEIRASLESEMTPSESAGTNGWSVNSGAAFDLMKEFKKNIDEQIKGGDKSTFSALVSNGTKRVMGSYITNTMSLWSTINDYNTMDNNLLALRAQEQQLSEELDFLQYADVTWNGNAYPYMQNVDQEITFGDHRYHLVMEDNENGGFRIADVQEYNSGLGTFQSVSDSDLYNTVAQSRQAKEAIESAMEQKKDIETARSFDGMIDDATAEKVINLRSIRAEIQDAEAYVEDNKEGYDRAMKQYEKQALQVDVQAKLLTGLGLDATELVTAEAVMQSLGQFAYYEPTVWDATTTSNILTNQLSLIESGKVTDMTREQVFEDASAIHEGISEEIKDLEWLDQYLDDNDINLDPSVRDNIRRKKASLERDLADIDSFMLQQDEDFKKKAQAGRQLEFEMSPKFGGSYNAYYQQFDVTPELLEDWGMASEEVYDRQLAFSDKISPDSLWNRVGGIENYRLLTEDEKDTYYYLLMQDNENGTNKAAEYISQLTDPTYGVIYTRKDEKVREEWAQFTEDNFILANAASVILSPVTTIVGGGYLAYSIISGNEYNPHSQYLIANNAKSTVREASKQEINETFGENNILSDIANLGYDIVMMRADSAMNASVFGSLVYPFFEKLGWHGEYASFWKKAVEELFTASPMGVSAMTDAVTNAKTNGASDAQAYAIGGFTLAAETLTEAISLDNMREARLLGKEFTVDGAKKFMLNWLGHAGVSEALGEGFTEIFEQKLDEYYLGDQSQHAERVFHYRLMNYDKDTADYLARQDEMNEVLYTALVAYLSPGLDVYQTVQGRRQLYRDVQADMNKYGGNYTLRDARNQVIADQMAERKANQEAEERWNNEEDFVPFNIPEETKAGKAANIAKDGSVLTEGVAVDFEILVTAQDSNLSAHDASVAMVLDEEGTQESKEISQAAANALHKVVGEETTPAQELHDVMAGAVVADINPSIVKQGFQVAALAGDKSAVYQIMQDENYQQSTPDVKAAAINQALKKDLANPEVQQAAQQTVHDFRIAAAEAALMSEGMGEEAQKADEEIYINQEVLATQIEKEEAAKTARDNAINAFADNPSEDNYKVLKEKNANYAARVAERQQAQETLDRSREEAKQVKQKAIKDIRAQAESAVAQQEQQIAEVKAQQEEQRKIEEAQAIAEAELQKKIQKASDEMDNFTKLSSEDLAEQWFPNASREARKQAATIIRNVQRKLSDTTDKILDRGEFAKNVAKKYKLKYVEVEAVKTNDGRWVPPPFNARIDPKTGALQVSTRAEQSDILYAVLVHEITHPVEGIENTSIYNELADTVLQMKYGPDVTFESVAKAMESGDLSSTLAQDVLAMKKRYDDTLGKDHSYREILQEIVADRVGYTIASDANALRQIVDTKPMVVRRVLSSIKNFLRRMAGMKGEVVTQAQQVATMLENALKEVSFKEQKGQQKNSISEDDNVLVKDNQGNAIVTELPGGTAVIDPMRYSLSSFDEDEQARVRAELLKRFPKADVDKYMKDALNVAAVIAADRTRLDFKASDNQVFLKPNNDYYFTLDASTLCAKRLLYQGTFDYVQHALPDEVFTPEDLIDLVNIMSQMGYETPCGICYVESRRRWLDTYAQKFLDKLASDPEALINKYFKKASDEEKAAMRERFAGEAPTIDDLTTSDGLENLRHNDPYMYRVFVADMNNKGTANPKVVQLRTEYRGDISKMTKNQIQNVKDIGGLRIQSFSDFETPHLLDMMQAVLDMSAVGLTSQAYTKVSNFAWVFGGTGIKINLSLIGKGTGLDAKGNLVFDNVEGINFDEAMKLRKKYNANVGTILVGINDDHIIAAMGDPRIDFIIPFHKSGWSDKELKGIPSLNNYSDYTNFQNELVILGQNEDGSYETESFKKHKERTGEELENLQPVGKNGYWNFDESGQWNAENYLKKCAELHRMPKFWQFLVDNGDGSFSLPQGNDKRSRAIREGYWKTLIDFKMYENDSYGRTKRNGTRTAVKGAKQQEVTPNINMKQAYRVLGDYKLGRQMPDKADGTKGKFIPMENNNSVPVATAAGDAFVEMIKNKRAGKKPVGPGPDTLEADLPATSNPRASAFGASTAPATLGNTENTAVEGSSAQQAKMAIDAETGETVKYSLPSDAEVDQFFDDYIDNLSAEELDKLAQELFGIPLNNPSERMATSNAETAAEEELDFFNNKPSDLYKEAIKNGDLSTARKIVDKVANAAGYTVRGTHRTNADFTVFDKSKQSGKNGKSLGDGFYVASGEGTEYDRDAYGKKRMLVYIKPGHVFNIQNGGITEDQAKEVFKKYFEPKHPNASAEDRPYYRHVISQLQNEYAVMNYIKEAADNANTTTDVIFKELGYDSIKDGPQYCVFDSEQIKLADPITYDDEGKEISIDERFNKANKDIRYSLPADEDYLDAVKRGNMDEAQRMVDEKAQEAGYNIIAVHGTNAEFNVFEKGDIGYHFGTEAQANAKANQKVNNHGGDKRMIRSYIKMENPLVLDFDAYSWDAPLMAARYISYEEHEKAGMPYDESETSTKVYKMFKDLGITDSDIERLRSWDDGNQYFDEILEQNGYDGIIYKNEVESNEGAYSYIVPLDKRGNIKNADPVTYDNNGEIIPLSERFTERNNDIRYSLPSDAPYLSAVERGEMDEAQRMVDERAEEAGYVVDAYHGTLNGGYTIFDKRKAHIGGNSGAGFYFSSNRDDSETNYSDIEGADNHFKAVHLAEKIWEYMSESDENEYAGIYIPENASYEDIKEIAKKMLQGNPQLYHVRLNPGRAYIRDGNNSTNLIEDTIKNFDESLYDRNDYDNEDDYYDAISMARSEEIYQAVSEAVYNGIADVDSNFEIISNIDYEKIISNLAEVAIDYEKLSMGDVIDMVGREYIDAIVGDGEETADATVEIARAIVEAFGYDSIEDREVGWKFNQIKNMGIADDTVHYIMFHPNQIKLADPVTYDNNGEVIPLSERFRTQNNDIRYSLPSDETIEQMATDYFTMGGTEASEEETEAPTGNRQFNIGMGQQKNVLKKAARDYLWENREYTKDTNVDQMNRALDWIAEHSTEDDPSGFYGAMRETEEKDFNAQSPDGQARMIALTAMAVNLKGKNESIETQKWLARRFGEEGTTAGQTLQARKMFRLMTPEGRIAVLLQLQDKVNKQRSDIGKPADITLDNFILRAASVAKTDADFEKAMKAARASINEQIPVSWKERLMAWRMFSMLCAPTTHERNIIGNALFVPIVGIKNKVGAALELGAQAVGWIDQDERTKTLQLRVTPERRQFAKEYANSIQDMLQGEGKYQEGDKLKRERKIFGTKDGIISKTLGKALQWAYSGTGKALELEDWLFLKGHFTRALAGYMTAQDLSPADMTEDTLQKAVAYAVEEAKKATYRDASAVADVLGNLNKLNPKRDNPAARRGVDFLQWIIDARLPFKKTPINIAKRGIEYSPIGFAKSLTYDLHHMRQYLAYENGKLPSLPKTAITPTQFIDKLASGLTGTGLSILGFLAGRAGLIRCAFDPEDPEDRLAKIMGEQEYSINPGKTANAIATSVGRIFDENFKCELFGEDVCMSLDWANPVCLPVFTGAAFESYVEDIDKDGSIFSKALKALTEIAEPMLDMSMLQSVNEFFNTSSYDSKSPIWQFFEGTGLNYLTSLIPTPIARLAKTIDPERRATFTQSGDQWANVNRTIEQIENKIPWLSMNNIPSMDAYGQQQERVIPAIVENFLSPAYFTRIQNKEVYNELGRLLEATNGNESVDRKKLVASNPDKTLKVDGKTTPLTDKQYAQLISDRGEIIIDVLGDLMSRNEYKIASDETKANMVTDAYAYATKVAKHHLDDRVELNDSNHNWIEKAYRNGNAADEIINSNIQKNRSVYIKHYSLGVAKALESGDDEDLAVSMAFLQEAGATDTEIRDAVSDYFRPLYYEAYANNDEPMMEEIEYKLSTLGVGYSNTTFKRWRNSAEKKISGVEDDEDEETDNTRWLNP